MNLLKKTKAVLFAAEAAAVLFLSSCAATQNFDPETTPPETLYNRALDMLLKKREYGKSAKAFDEIDRYYPYSRWALRAQIMEAFAYYVRKDYDESVIVLDRFLQLYPGNSFASYAYYLKALCYYAQISDTERGQKMTQMALDALMEVVRRFPDTPYAEDASKKIVLAQDYLAAKEVNIGRFYLKQNAHIAAMNRFMNVIRNYQTTQHVQEALYRLTETYLILGLDGEAQKSAAVLGYNYPSGQWYARAYDLMKQYVPASIAAERKD
ncbi:MAG: outer membrane protein assembly factor BamD [Alphaproteobacteria bacterium]|nr:outer membrane protein assembly factor BamD [Alphaproteobacteria bacterium]